MEPELPVWPEVEPEEPIDPEEPEVLPLCPYVEPEDWFEALPVSEVPLWPDVAVEPELPVLFCAVLLDELGFCEFDIDPLLFVSLPVEFVDVVPFDAVDVPGCDAWLPAVELVPDTEPD